MHSDDFETSFDCATTQTSQTEESPNFRRRVDAAIALRKRKNDWEQILNAVEDLPDRKAFSICNISTNLDFGLSMIENSVAVNDTERPEAQNSSHCVCYSNKSYQDSTFDNSLTQSFIGRTVDNLLSETSETDSDSIPLSGGDADKLEFDVSSTSAHVASSCKAPRKSADVARSREEPMKSADVARSREASKESADESTSDSVQFKSSRSRSVEVQTTEEEFTSDTNSSNFKRVSSVGVQTEKELKYIDSEFLNYISSEVDRALFDCPTNILDMKSIKYLVENELESPFYSLQVEREEARLLHYKCFVDCNEELLEEATRVADFIGTVPMFAYYSYHKADLSMEKIRAIIEIENRSLLREHLQSKLIAEEYGDFNYCSHRTFQAEWIRLANKEAVPVQYLVAYCTDLAQKIVKTLGNDSLEL